MIPVLIGLGVTFGLLTVKSGVSAFVRLKHLKPVEIARLNGIMLDFHTQPDKNFMKNGQIDHELVRRIKQYPGGFYDKMNENEACLILGIDEQEIMKLDQKMLKRKHMKTMMLNHPDRGGSVYISSKINEAREVLRNSYLIKK